MVKKIQKSAATNDTSATTASPLSGAIKESAQQIWLAGLGAFSKAQAEGGKAFETLVKEGLTIQRKTQSVAEDRINEATQRMSSMANDIGSKAAGQWDKLENIFEDRVAKALGKLGVPSARDIETLMARIDELNRHVQQLSGLAPVEAAPSRQRTRAARTSAPKTKAVAKKVPAKTAASRKTPVRKAATPKV